MRRFAVLAAALVLTISTVPVLGQEVEADLTGTTIAVGGRDDQDLVDVSRSVGVVTAEDLQDRPGQTLVDLLDEEIGVHAQTTNRGAGAPFIRGQVGPSNLMVFDQLRLSRSTRRTGPNQYLNLIDAFSLDGIEILRGAGGVLYGSEAIGGTIRFLPRALTYNRGFGAEVTTRFQSADTSVDLAPHASWSSDNVSLLAGGTFSNYGTLRVGGGDATPVSDYTKWAAHVGVGWLVQPRTELEARYFVTSVQDAGRSERLLDNSVRFYDNVAHLAYLALDHIGDGAFAHVDASVGVHVLTEDVTRHDCATGDVYGITGPDGDPIETTLDAGGCIDADPGVTDDTRVNADDVIALVAALTITSELGPEGLDLVWGIDGSQDFVSSSRTDRDPDTGDTEDRRGNFPNDAGYGQYGAFSQLRWGIDISERFRLRPELGGRATLVTANATDDALDEDVDYTFFGVAGSAQIVGTLDDTHSVYTSYNQGFRAPNVQETLQIGDTGEFFEVANPDLGPERAHAVELGLREVTDRIEANAVIWGMWLDDFIGRRDATFEGQTEIDGVGVVERTNLGQALFWGAEFDATLDRVWQGLGFGGGLSYTFGETGSGDGAEPARRTPPLRYRALLRYDLDRPRAFAALVVQGAGRQDRLSSGDIGDIRICESAFPGVRREELGQACAGTAPWTTLGLRVGADFGDNMSLRGHFENILDANYRMHGSGLDAPGFNAGITLVGRY